MTSSTLFAPPFLRVAAQLVGVILNQPSDLSTNGALVFGPWWNGFSFCLPVRLPISRLRFTVPTESTHLRTKFLDLPTFAARSYKRSVVVLFLHVGRIAFFRLRNQTQLKTLTCSIFKGYMGLFSFFTTYKEYRVSPEEEALSFPDFLLTAPSSPPGALGPRGRTAALGRFPPSPHLPPPDAVHHPTTVSTVEFPSLTAEGIYVPHLLPSLTLISCYRRKRFPVMFLTSFLRRSQGSEETEGILGGVLPPHPVRSVCHVFRDGFVDFHISPFTPSPCASVGTNFSLAVSSTSCSKGIGPERPSSVSTPQSHLPLSFLFRVPWECPCSISPPS